MLQPVQSSNKHNYNDNFLSKKAMAMFVIILYGKPTLPGNDIDFTCSDENFSAQDSLSISTTGLSASLLLPFAYKKWLSHLLFAFNNLHVQPVNNCF